MKKLLFSSVFFLALLIIGCQENSITNPVENPAKSDKQTVTTVANSIELSERLDTPYPVFNAFIDLQGVVSYQMTLYPLDPIPPLPQTTVVLDLSIDANLTNICTVCEPIVNNVPAGVVSDQTSDVVQLNGDGTYSLTKAFAVHQSEDSMVLKIRFLIYTGEVTIDAIWLELSDGTAQSDNRQS